SEAAEDRFRRDVEDAVLSPVAIVEEVLFLPLRSIGARWSCWPHLVHEKRCQPLELQLPLAHRLFLSVGDYPPPCSVYGSAWGESIARKKTSQPRAPKTFHC